MSIRIALAGNPNSGKTTVFNALTGSSQFVGNWPGVTVEKKEGRLRGHEGVTVADLPGIYSLSAYTPEEIVARDFLIREKPDAALNVVDGTNLERSLYLTTQLLETGVPMVVALNMMDVVNREGTRIGTQALSQALGCPVVEISALKGRGLADAAQAAVAAAQSGAAPAPLSFSPGLEAALRDVTTLAGDALPADNPRWHAIKLFERDGRVMAALSLPPETLSAVEARIRQAERELDDDAEGIVTNARYQAVAALLSGVYQREATGKPSVTERIDRVVTNRFLALPVFALMMLLLYSIAVTTVGAWATDWMNEGVFGEGWHLFGAFVPGIPALLEGALTGLRVAPWLTDLLLDGVVGGVGAVLGFAPQIFTLFLLLGILEGSGYMARVAFIMDKLLRRFGLSGKSFIPMLLGTGCSVPGILASRTIESEADRRMTVITTSFMPCGAKLPVIALFSAALFGGAAWVAPSAYFLGIAAILASGVTLRKTRAFAAQPAPFVMELPAYRLPTLKNLLLGTWERGFGFVRKAGSIILLSSIGLWFISSFGWTGGRFGWADPGTSVLAALGRVIAPLFAPLGFGTWEAAAATVTGLIAKENVVGAMGVLGGATGDAGAAAFAQTLFTPLSGYSFLIFNLLCVPCLASVGAIRREMHSPRWTAFALLYQTALAYAVSLILYQMGLLLSGAPQPLGAAAAVALLCFIAYLFLRPAAMTPLGQNPSSRSVRT